MEYIVRLVKDNLKVVYLNKIEKIMAKRILVLLGMKVIIN